MSKETVSLYSEIIENEKLDILKISKVLSFMAEKNVDEPWTTLRGYMSADRIVPKSKRVYEINIWDDFVTHPSFSKAELEAGVVHVMSHNVVFNNPHLPLTYDPMTKRNRADVCIIPTEGQFKTVRYNNTTKDWENSKPTGEEMMAYLETMVLSRIPSFLLNYDHSLYLMQDLRKRGIDMPLGIDNIDSYGRILYNGGLNAFISAYKRSKNLQEPFDTTELLIRQQLDPGNHIDLIKKVLKDAGLITIPIATILFASNFALHSKD